MRIRDVSGEVAIVTGTTSGVGKAVASALIELGVHVIGVARGSHESEGLISDSGAERGRYIHVTGDASQPETASEAVQVAMENFGQIDTLINNVGVGTYADLLDSDIELYDEIMNTNMRSTFLFTRRVVEHMISRKKGLILQISSQAGLNGYGGESIYCASKHAQVGFSHALRHELAPHGIKVGVICPAGIETRFALGRGRTQQGINSAGYLAASDVADAVVFAMTQSLRATMVDIGLVAITER